MISENQKIKTGIFAILPRYFLIKSTFLLKNRLLESHQKNLMTSIRSYIYGVLFPSVIDDYRAVIRGVSCFVNQFEIRIAGRDIVSVNAIVQCRRDNGSRIGG